MDRKSHCDSLWALSVAILTLFWGVEKSEEKSVEKSHATNHASHAEAGLWLP